MSKVRKLGFLCRVAVVTVLFFVISVSAAHACTVGYFQGNGLRFSANVGSLTSDIQTNDVISFSLIGNNTNLSLSNSLTACPNNICTFFFTDDATARNGLTRLTPNDTLILTVKNVRTGQTLCQTNPSAQTLRSQFCSVAGCAEPEPAEDPNFTATSMLTQADLDALNPLKQYSMGVNEDLSTPGGIISRVLVFAFPLAGIILFVMLVWSGFEIFTGATSGKKSLDAGKQRATAAVIGFFLLFVSYWLAQLLEVIFGVTIL